MGGIYVSETFLVLLNFIVYNIIKFSFFFINFTIFQMDNWILMKLVEEDKIIDFKFGKQINIVKCQSTWPCIYTIIMLQVIIVNYLFYN